MRTVLLADVSGDYPMSYAETPSGLLLIANGVDPVIRWNGLTGTADHAGVAAPTTPVQLGGVGVGTIAGRYVAYQRFIDKFGNPSNLSPVSNVVEAGRDALIDRVSYDPTTGVVTIRSEGHGLATGEAIVISGVEGLELVNGTWTITRVDDDTFTINGLTVTNGRYREGGVWTWGVATIVYGAVEPPAEAKVAKRQILRNLDGNAETFYVDVETEDLTATAFVSPKTDEQLAAGTPVPLVFDDDLPAANRFGVPPSHKAVVASHLGRIFATADVTYSEGHVEPVFGSRVVRGVGTRFRANFAGRLLYVVGALQAYEIAAVDTDAQELTLATEYADSTGPFGGFAIRSAPGERRLVYYSEPALPEAWPPWNAIALPEDGDEIIGLMVKGSFLYILERRHIYRFTFQNDPARDGNPFLATMRGCLNNRCHVQVEDRAYMLDEAGIHAFDGGQESQDISTPIQTLFQQGGLGGLQVNWNADQKLWHAAHDPVKETIRWFVAMSGNRLPRHAICFDYRQERWWVEEYPVAVTSSVVGTIGYRRSLVGSEARRVLCLGEGTLDGVDAGHG
ncbi:MAG: hypothetical protein IRY99_24205, partial [Isosphaeraceae bacterium]|nr:hypothetical protein [Isosphaeraceae bacterium]